MDAAPLALTAAGPPGWQPPPFCRTSWSSAAARALWEPRLAAARAALEDLAVLRCADDAAPRIAVVRPASLERLRALAAGRGVKLRSLGVAPATADAVAAGRFGRLLVALGDGTGGRPADAAPESAPGEDPVWTLACLTPGAAAFDEGRGMTVAGNWAANPLLAAIGLAAAAPWPAGFDCPAAAAHGEALLAAAEMHGLAGPVADLREALSWPVTWTALHGIAEVKTPIFRFIRNSPPTRTPYTVRRRGTVFPQEAAKGLGAPFLDRARPRAAAVA